MNGIASVVYRTAALVAVTAGIVAVPQQAAAQYTPQVLTPPVDLAPSSSTQGFGLNARGQVYGVAVAAGNIRKPVLWTGGAPQTLQLPTGSSWDGVAGHQFLNDNSTAVSRVSFAANVPGGSLTNVLRWRNGGAPELMPAPPPSTMSPPACSTSYANFQPMGLNNHDHVLFLATDTTGTCPWILWLWDGLGGAPGDFHELTRVGGDESGCTPGFFLRFDAQHLNDADPADVSFASDHVALDFNDGHGPSCPDPHSPFLFAGIFANGTFTPRIPLPGVGGQNTATGIDGLNNHDQFLAWGGNNNTPDVQLWNGSAIVDLDLAGGVYINDLGHVVYRSLVPGHQGVKLYKSGSSADVPLPTVIPGFVLDSSTPAVPVGINSTGQLLMSMEFVQDGVFTDHIVLLTPTPPTLTLHVNNEHPTNPPVVHTNGPLSLTIDISSSAYTGTLAWYWALVINNQVVWVTSTGISTTPAPLAMSPPIALTAELLNVNLTSGSTIVSLFALVDSSSAVVAADVIAATRP